MFVLRVVSTTTESEVVGVFSSQSKMQDAMAQVAREAGYTTANYFELCLRAEDEGIQYWDVRMKGSAQWSMLFIVTQVELDVARDREFI